MRWLVDTNVVSELRKLGKGTADPCVTRWAAARLPEDMAISVVTLLELERGVRQIEGRDPRQAAVARTWLDAFVKPTFEGRILPVNEAVALEAARILASGTAPLADTLIAATALVHHLTVATRNTAHFRPINALKTIDPWAASP